MCPKKIVYLTETKISTMRNTTAFIALATLTCLGACSKQTAEQASTATPQLAEGSSLENSDGNSPAGSELAQESAEAEMDYGDWLKLPDSLDERYKQAYPPLVKSAIAGDVSGQINLALVSQQIASVLARAGQSEEVYSFLLQSARALRAALPAGSAQLNEATMSNIFFNEACALSRSGKLPAAKAALNDAIERGFTNLSAIDSDDDLAALRESEGFDTQLDAWRTTIAEKVRALAAHDLSAGESFPFDLAGTDISGAAVELAQLQGQVVIVDFWGTWCPPCRAEIPSFIRLQGKFAEQGFTMIGLNFERKSSEEENLATVVDYVKEVGINYPCIMGNQEMLAQVPGFAGYPTTLFIDKTGKVRMKVVGLHAYEYLEAVVTELLAE
jgi:thiol-disulfide isomerase/thioredoxin